MGKEVRTPFEFVELTTSPANPPSGSVLIYAKTDGKFYQLTSAGVETNLTATAGGSELLAKKFIARTDCISNTNTNEFSYTVSGTGAAFSTLATGNNNALGVLRLALGTTATGRGAIAPVNLGVLLFGKGIATFESDARIVTLSDATNTYALRVGFIDSITAEATDGVFFRYTHSVNGGRFQAVCRNNNTESVVDTAITATANIWYDFEITVNASATSAEFKINGSVVATITTNIPTASGRETGYGLACNRTAGTAAVNAIDVDFIDISYEFTTQR